MPPRANAPDPFAEFAVSDTAAADPFSEFAAPTAPVSAANPQGASLVASTPLRRFGAALPGVGSFIGGFAGKGIGMRAGPAGRAGAALGGGAGEAFNQLIQYGTGAPDQPTTSAESANRILREGAIGAGAQYTGEVLAGGANALGRRAIKSAIGQSTLNTITRRYTKNRRFPLTAEKLINTVIREDLPINRRGIALADKRVDELVAGKQREIAAADRTGAKSYIDRALAPVYKWHQELRRSATGDARATEVEALLQQVWRKFGKGHLTPSRLDEMIGDAQKLGFRTGEHTATTPIEQQFNRKLVRGAFAEYQSIAPKAARLRNQTNSIMAARDAITAATDRGGITRTRAGIALGMAGLGATVTPGGVPQRSGGALGATALTAAALSRPGLSGAGLFLTHPLLAQLLLRSPNALRALAGAAAEPPLDEQQP